MSPSHSEIYLSSILIPSSNIGNSLSRNKAFVKQTHLHIASYTLHILSYTFYLTRCILHIASYTLHSTICILCIVSYMVPLTHCKNLLNLCFRNLGKVYRRNLSNMNWKIHQNNKRNLSNIEISQLQKTYYKSPYNWIKSSVSSIVSVTLPSNK